MKTLLTQIIFASLLFFTACRPSVDAKVWEKEIKPEMQAHKAWLVAFSTIADYNVKKNADYFDQDPYKHFVEAYEFIQDYVEDSLGSYKEVANLHEILLEKDKEGTLTVDNSDNLDDQLGGALANALFGGLFGGIYDNYTKKYVLKVSEYLQSQFNAIEITLDSPEFVQKTKDRITYSVHCPTYNENYTLSFDINSKDYYWSLSE